MYAERAAATMARYRQTAATATDEAAVKSPELFPAWEAGGVSYAVGDRMRYGDLLYKCLTVHTSQESWTPDAARACGCASTTRRSSGRSGGSRPEARTHTPRGQK